MEPDEGKTVLVGSDVAGVYRSDDEGEHFVPCGKGLTGFAVADIAFSAHRPGLVLVLTDDGLYGDWNGGKDWAVVSRDLRYTKRCCAGHLITFDGDRAYVGTDQGVFVVDVAQNPATVRGLPGLEKVSIHAVAVHYGTVFVGTDKGIYRYQEGWASVSQGLVNGENSFITDLLAHPDGHLYAVDKTQGFYEWDGAQWLPRSVGFVLSTVHKVRSFKSLSIHPTDSAQVIMTTHPEEWPHRVLFSSNRGWSWRPVENFHVHPKAPKNWATAPHAIERVAFSPCNPKTIFMTDWWNLWKTTDGGAFWFSGYSGLQNTVINDIKRHPYNAEHLFASVADNGFMVSLDGGLTWERRMTGLPDGHAVEMEISRSNPDKMYLLLNPWQKDGRKVYVYRSMDGGKTWRDISFYLASTTRPQVNFITGEPTNVEIDASSDDIVYVATNGYGIYKTVNGGLSWKAIHMELPHHAVKGPGAVRSVDGFPGLLYVSTVNGGIYKSPDGGEHWQRLPLEETMTFGLAVRNDGKTIRLAAACPEKKVALSDDGGASWRWSFLPGERPEHVAAYAVAFDPLNPDILAVATSAYHFRAAHGVYVSKDGGAHFKALPMPETMPRLSIFSLLYAQPQTLYVGFNGLGVYQMRWREP
ncbi:YCF48-related protein [Desulfosoma sp.]